jgi:hypothetical protein
VNWTYQRSPNIFLPLINGQFRFFDWDGFFANQPDSDSIASGPSSLDFREYDTFLYGGDDWKVSQNLTVQLGLTWSYYGQPANIFNDITTKRESNPATAFWNTALPLNLRTLPTIPAPKNSVGPSVGFVYSPQWGGFLTGHGKTTFRGGYRLLYDPPFYNIYLNIATSAPEVFNQTLAGPGLGGTAPGLPAVPTGPNVRTLLAPSLTPGVSDPRTFSQTSIAPNFGPDKVHTWTFGFERELTKNTAFEARYVGNHGYNLFQTINANPRIDALAASFPNLVPAGLTPCPASQAFASVAVGRINCNEGIIRERNNGGYSNYNALQTEFRANNLFKQLTMRMAYTHSKTLDNVSEIFSTFGGGNSSFIYQNPANPKGPGEYSFSGLDYPNQWSVLFTEQLPFFKEQHGLTGHILGGWALSANYILTSGQRYTPTQFFSARTSDGAANNFVDSSFTRAFNSSAESARPFLGNLSAPATQVGIFQSDACRLFITGAFSNVGGTGPGGAQANMCDSTIQSPTALISLTDLIKALSGNNPADPTTFIPGTVSNNQVRVITNAKTAQTVFGTPFGNMPRNPVQDAMQNIGNASIFKNVKLGEHASFEFRTTLLNVFNHSNFTTIDPIIEDAGSTGAFTGFGDVTQNPSITRRIIFGGKLTF